MRHVAVGPGYEEFRLVARGLLAARVAPREVSFEGQEQAQLGLLPEHSDMPAPSSSKALTVPKRFVELAEVVSLHRSPTRWPLLYEALFRLTHNEPTLLHDPTNPLTASLDRMRRSVHQDTHDVHAFVRFRKVEGDEPHFVAWYEPEHRCLRLAVPHFARRFAAMRWSILTPDETAHWDLKAMRFGPGVTRNHAPEGDELEDLWRTYYGSVFNPARLNVEALERQLPRRHWHNLPEATLFTDLIRSAPRRTGGMLKGRPPSASAALVPDGASVSSLGDAAHGCRLCPWALRSTQTVFGEGPERARVMLIGEQPGDHEDLEGRPFIGPAGAVLDKVLHEVGLPRERLYVTNAVKHFKFTPDDRGTGKKRLHEKPSYADAQACFGWLEAELAAVRPELVVLLGATAGQSLFGPTFRLVRSRGQFFETPWAKKVIATYHPSAVLRAVTPEASKGIEQTLREDLAKVAAVLASSPD